MFTEKLYDHKFDIDDILMALCGDVHKGRWLLNTRHSTLIKEPANKQDPLFKNKGDQNHHHIINPLPLSVLQEIKNHPSLLLQEDVLQKEIIAILNTATTLHDLWLHFDTSRSGNWLRERIKEIALEWLLEQGLMPPSMLHITQQKNREVFSANTPAKIKILME